MTSIIKIITPTPTKLPIRVFVSLKNNNNNQKYYYFVILLPEECAAIDGPGEELNDEFTTRIEEVLDSFVVADALLIEDCQVPDNGLNKM